MSVISEAENSDYDEVIVNAIQNGLFKSRPLSWVAETDDLFLKIPSSNKSSSCLLKPESLTLDYARDEWRDTELLLNLSNSGITRSLGFSTRYACLVYKRLVGRDMRDLLLEDASSSRSKKLLNDSAQLLAVIHHGSQCAIVSHLQPRDYRDDEFLPLHDLPSNHNQTIVIDGFEIRNLKLDANSTLTFYDPHNLHVGYPEEDFSRFIISLLMVTWGKLGRFAPWYSFDYQKLMQIYQQESGISLKPKILRYCFERNYRMRDFNASASIGNMSRTKAILAVIYKKKFFFQMYKWINENV